MKFITFHWTAGTYNPSVHEKNHYHFLIDGSAKLHAGRFLPEANIPNAKNGQLLDGRYAAHCGGGNSFNIGIGLCGMAGYQSPKNQGTYPLKQETFDSACKLAAELCQKYRISIDQDHVFTHMEFGLRHPKTSSYGKIDISFLPWQPSLKPKEVGDFIRSKIKQYAV